jgi:hypothetical protein
MTNLWPGKERESKTYGIKAAQIEFEETVTDTLNGQLRGVNGDDSAGPEYSCDK